jgi:hypothetical protein
MNAFKDFTVGGFKALRITEVTRIQDKGIKIQGAESRGCPYRRTLALGDFNETWKLSPEVRFVNMTF